MLIAHNEADGSSLRQAGYLWMTPARERVAEDGREDKARKK